MASSHRRAGAESVQDRWARDVDDRGHRGAARSSRTNAGWMWHRAPWRIDHKMAASASAATAKTTARRSRLPAGPTIGIASVRQMAAESRRLSDRSSCLSPPIAPSGLPSTQPNSIIDRRPSNRFATRHRGAPDASGLRIHQRVGSGERGRRLGRAGRRRGPAGEQGRWRHASRRKSLLGRCLVVVGSPAPSATATAANPSSSPAESSPSRSRCC